LRARSYYQPEGFSECGADYARRFVPRAHELIARGYAKLTPSDFCNAEEDDITGEIVRAVDAVLDDGDAPSWACWFSIHDDPHIHDPDRKGKRRRRLDIRIDSSERHPRSRLGFEAKRLGSKHGCSAYLGAEGLGCFLTGKYAADNRAGAMLGYVQQGQPADWAKKIGQAIAKKAAQLSLLPSSPWSPHRLTPRLRHTYRSGHDRPTLGSPIEIYHTFLLFN